MHMCISVRGVLRWPDRLLRQYFKGVVLRDGVTLTTPDQIRDAFMDELAEGHEVIPFGDACEGFDYKKGCPGHPKPAPAALSREGGDGG